MLSLLAAALAGCGATEGTVVDVRGMYGMGETHYYEVQSESVEQRYLVYVRLPEGYAGSPDRYPVAYVLDGGMLYPLLSAYYRYLNLAEDMPETILVGISYGTDDWRAGNNRSRDYTAPSAERDFWGGAGRFQSFLADELMPCIEATYRTRPDRRIVFGQSLGGQFVLYTALTRPGLFWGHIASNPALHRNLPFFLEQPQDPAGSGVRSHLFVASGSLDDPVFREPALAWMEAWQSVENPPWQLRTVTLDGHNHHSAAPAAFRDGMTWLFAINPPPKK